jgi:hypothetical protein
VELGDDRLYAALGLKRSALTAKPPADHIGAIIGALRKR